MKGVRGPHAGTSGGEKPSCRQPQANVLSYAWGGKLASQEGSDYHLRKRPNRGADQSLVT